MSEINFNGSKQISFRDDEECMAFEKFKTVVADLQQDDTVLIRFLRARERNLENAEKMLRTSVTWRKENDIASYLKYTPPSFLKDEFHIWHRITGNDNEGRPVLWLPLGGVFAKECIEAGHQDIIFKWCYHMLESGLNAIEQSESQQIIAIIALEDLALKKIMHIETMQTLYKACQVFEQNYPEVVRSIAIINAPWYFSIAYNIVKPILSEHTVSKLRIFDSNKANWMKFLEDIMPQESIPEKYLEY